MFNHVQPVHCRRGCALFCEVAKLGRMPILTANDVYAVRVSELRRWRAACPKRWMSRCNRSRVKSCDGSTALSINTDAVMRFAISCGTVTGCSAIKWRVCDVMSRQKTSPLGLVGTIPLHVFCRCDGLLGQAREADVSALTRAPCHGFCGAHAVNSATKCIRHLHPPRRHGSCRRPWVPRR